MKNLFFFLLLQFIIVNFSAAITPLEFRLRDIRDTYRHSPGEAVPEIEKLWRDFPSANDRTRIFLDLTHYYKKHSLNKLLFRQGTWLIRQEMSGGIKSRIWTMIPIAETLADQGKINEAVEYYENAFILGCNLLGKEPAKLSREEFIRTGVEGTALYGKTAKNSAFTFAKAEKFNDAFNILRFSKTMPAEDDFDPDEIMPGIDKNMIIILGLFEKKYSEACGKLRSFNGGNPFLNIEQNTVQTPEEEICLNAGDYELLADIYINTLTVNPPCEFITYQKIVINGRSTLYILNKITGLMDNEAFRTGFEKAINNRQNSPVLPHINVLFAEYYAHIKNLEQARLYYQKALKQGKNQIYRWPRYYPDINLNENYRAPHRPHLWTTCYKTAKHKLDKAELSGAKQPLQ